MSQVVYTAISQGYDRLQPVPIHARRGATFVAFLETSECVEPWEIRPLERRHTDRVRDVRAYKILPQRFFPEAEISLWLDGKMELAVSLDRLLEFLQDADLAVFDHASRCCLYEEACHCIHRRLDDPEIMYRQIQRYTRAGFPANWGLVDTAVLLRRHNPKMEEFCRTWWQEIEHGSRRDQLSFTYCAWKCGLKFRLLPGFTHRNQLFKIHRHLRSLQPPSTGSPLSQ